MDLFDELRGKIKKKYTTYSKCLEYIKIFFEIQTCTNYPIFQITIHNFKFKSTQ